MPPLYTVTSGPDAGDTVAAFQWTAAGALDAAAAFLAEYVADPDDFKVTSEAKTSVVAAGHQQYRETSVHLLVEVYQRLYDLDDGDWLIVGDLDDERRDARTIRRMVDAAFRRNHKEALQ